MPKYSKDKIKRSRRVLSALRRMLPDEDLRALSLALGYSSQHTLRAAMKGKGALHTPRLEALEAYLRDGVYPDLRRPQEEVDEVEARATALLRGLSSDLMEAEAAFRKAASGLAALLPPEMLPDRTRRILAAMERATSATEEV